MHSNQDCLSDNCIMSDNKGDGILEMHRSYAGDIQNFSHSIFNYFLHDKIKSKK